MSESNHKKRTFRAHNVSAIEHLVRIIKTEFLDGDTEAKKTVICEQVEPVDRVVSQESWQYIMHFLMEKQGGELDERDAFLTVHRDELIPKQRTQSNGAAATEEGKQGKRKRGKKSTPPSGGEQA
jgi:hypothetical protein